MSLKRVLCYVYTKYDVNGNSRKGWLWSDDNGKVGFVQDDGRSIGVLLDLGFIRDEIIFSQIPEVYTTPARFKELIKQYP